MRELLRNPSYRWLFAAQVIALVGTGLATVALGLLAYDLADVRAGEILGTVLAIKMVAYVCVSPLAGAWAGRVPRRLLLVGADVVRIGVVLLLPWVGEVWQVYLLIAVLQAASATFTPTFQSVLPDVLPNEEDYTKALSASQFAVSLENVASPVLAAFLLLFVDFHLLFVGTAAGFLVSAVLVLGVVIPAVRGGGSGRFTDRVLAGLRVVVATPRLRAVLALNMVVAGAGAITLVNTVNVVRDLLGATAAQVPLLLAVSGVGTATAALATPSLVRRVGDRVSMLTGVAVAVAAVSGALALAAVPSWPLAVGVWLLIGLGTGLIMVPIGRVVRSSSTAADRPAVFAAQFSLSHLCWLVTYPLAGWVGAAAGFTTAWAVLGALVLAAGLTARRLWPAGLSEVVRHRHHAGADPGHLTRAEWDGATWVHSHRVVIDANHTRWPRPA
ncbi:MFS transporter [Micromonospora rosaria]|uniref:MFS transporter n=1 Tax=Micromonospora rosaria TaxID=47874 RepID=A0A136PUG4_9ACTN|nr:MFS transporter [Micromonospora rosaria]KXK62072.1 MFS transporter [Micromonospora rosaria]